jgi:hypothetical protein
LHAGRAARIVSYTVRVAKISQREFVMLSNHSRCASLTIVLAASLSLTGCQESRPTVSMDDPAMGVFVNAVLPRTIEIQHYLTRPRSFAGSGDADGVELILAAKDAVGDDVKAVGTFNFELYTLRQASGDKLGQRMGFWSTTIDSPEALSQHWDRVTRFLSFKLELDEGKLPPGQYVLTAALVPPGGTRIADEYQFSHVAPAASP